MGKPKRPSIVRTGHLHFLDILRDSGVTNMYGAGTYLDEQFPELKRGEAHIILQYWMDSFSDRKAAGETAA